jgi:hypothetical protein
MVAVPVATAMTCPPGDVTVATVSSELDQPTVDPEIVFWVPSEYVAVAVSWTVLFTARVDEAGVMKIELMEGLIKKPLQAADVRHRTTAMAVAGTDPRPIRRRTL